MNTKLRKTSPPFGGNAYASDAEHVPDSLDRAVRLWTESAWARETFGDDQELDREDLDNDRTSSDDEVRGHSEEGEDIDPDDPEADIDRDDSVTD